MNYTNMAEADEGVVEKLVNTIKNKEEFVQQYKERAKKKKEDGNDIKLFEDKLADSKGRRSRIIDAYEAGAIELEEMVERRGKLDKKIEEAEKSLKEVADKSKIEISKDEILDTIKNIEDVKQCIKKDKERLRARLITILDKVEVTRIKKGEQKINISLK